MPFDLVKLPHHGSRNNVSRALVQAVESPLWVFSSDGTTFRHPDAIAVSRVVRDAGGSPHLVFNVPSTFNGWWQRPEWQYAVRLHHDVRRPGRRCHRRPGVTGG